MTSVWDFGGYPYGLAPLVLPHPGSHGCGDDRAAVAQQLALLREHVPSEPVRPESVDQLFWFRWIVGNQAASALWQILDTELGLVLSDELPSAARNATALLDGYSALLVYAGTPTLSVYRQLIRPAMARQHRSFSGRWAVDYVPVMTKAQALRAAYRKRPCPDAVVALLAASKRNHRTHVAVAAKLVPGEDSLLKRHDGLALGVPTDERARLYDAFYSTVRAPVSRETVVAQLLHRLRAMLWDLDANGLYPAEASSAGERPAELWDAEIAAIEQNIDKVVKETGEAAVSALRHAAESRREP